MNSSNCPFETLEEGEIINSSIENSLIDLQSTIRSTNYSADYSSSNHSSNISNNSALTYQSSSKYLADHSFIDSERSFMEMFSNELNQELPDRCPTTIRGPKIKFTGWTKQLMDEQQKKQCKDELAIKLAEQQRAKEESLRMREKAKLLNFSNDISRCLREKRSDIVYKIVEMCGYNKSSELCEEAKRIYNTTGMQTAEGRKRTLGGCFFQLVKLKGDLNESQKREIFYEPTSKMNRKKKQIKNAKNKVKKQLRAQSNKLEQIKNEFANMNLDINVRLK